MKIVYLDLKNVTDKVLEGAFFVMSEERRKKCTEFKNPDDRKRCIAADMLAREVISEETGIPAEEIVFGTDGNGKPFVENGNVYFNVSHSAHYVAAAVSKECEVGIDVECFRPVSGSVTRYFCSEKDIRFIFGSSPTETDKKITEPEILERFFRVWCFKEAYFKKTGEGIGKHACLISYEEQPKKEILLPDGIIVATE